MKTFRILGSIFCVFGFIFALLGILSSIFPLIENEHFKLIMSSFQETSTDPLTNTLNTFVRFCLRSSYFLLFCGISLMVAGGLISSTAHKNQTAFDDTMYSTQSVSSVTSETFGIPIPAYYPGGMEPVSPQTLGLGEAPKITLLDNDEPLDFGFAASLKSETISGRIKTSFSSDENDAQKLMHNDQQLKAQKQAEPLKIPDYAQYLSNSLTDETNITSKHGDQPPDEHKQHAATQLSKPRIVSTMDKRRF